MTTLPGGCKFVTFNASYTVKNCVHSSDAKLDQNWLKIKLGRKNNRKNSRGLYDVPTLW
jgi:hypothetical protein